MLRCSSREFNQISLQSYMSMRGHNKHWIYREIGHCRNG